jgi:hypothetical protein
VTPELLSISLGKVLIISKALGAESGLTARLTAIRSGSLRDPRLFSQTHRFFAFLEFFLFFYFIFLYGKKKIN